MVKENAFMSHPYASHLSLESASHSHYLVCFTTDKDSPWRAVPTRAQRSQTSGWSRSASMPSIPRGVIFFLFLLVMAFVLCSSAATLDAEERQVGVEVKEVNEKENLCNTWVTRLWWWCVVLISHLLLLTMGAEREKKVTWHGKVHGNEVWIGCLYFMKVCDVSFWSVDGKVGTWLKAVWC